MLIPFQSVSQFIPYQSTKAGLFLGTSIYHGELCPTIGCSFKNTGFTIGARAQYHIFKKWYFSPSFAWNRLSGNDADGENMVRNLSFRSDNFIFEGDVMYYLSNYHDYSKTKINLHPFVSLGVGGIFFNPKAALNDSWVALQPLQTEGESYARFSAMLSPAIGFKVRLNKTIDLRVQYSYYYTFTDYLDDVSSSYVDNSSLYGNAAILADRTTEGGFIPNETNDGEHWKAGSPRGSKGFDRFSSISVGFEMDIIKNKYK